MRPATLSKYLNKAITRNYPVIVKGKPGIGKTDIIKAAAEASGAELILSYPVVCDPTDFKGLPFPTGDGRADFLPYGDMDKLARVTQKTVHFADDIGHAPFSVQAAYMQLILTRQINGIRISDHVTFLAATNRREDKAGVTNLLEPLKSRAYTIIELEVNAEDWVKWAIANNMPAELIAFIKFNPNSLDGFQPSKDIVNSASPRTVTHLGIQQRDGLDPDEEVEVFAGAAGEVFASEYISFLNLYRTLPSLDEIIADPGGAVVPDNASILYALTTGLSRKMTDGNIGAICTYLERIEPEYAVACMTDATTRDKLLCRNRAYIIWAKDHKVDIL